MCCVSWDREVKVTDGVIVANQPTLRWGDDLSYLCGPSATPRVLVSERGRQEGPVRVVERVRDATLLSLTMEEGAVSQKIQAPSRSWNS